MKRTSAPRLILDHAGETRELTLSPGSQILGRSKASSDLAVRDGSLSKQHVELVLEDDGCLVVVDLGSKNGTQVNGRSVRQTALKNGDALRCGKLTFVVAGLASDEEPEALDSTDDGSGVFLALLDADSRVPVAGQILTLGSRSSNDVVISGEGVSRYHAELVFEEASWWVRDLGARNGVKVNGERIDDTRKLAPNDEIMLGTQRVRFEVVQANPLASAQKAAFNLVRDPVGAVKKDPRVRRGVAAALAAAVLLMIAGSGGGAVLVTRSHSASGPWLAEGSKHLLAGEYADARTIFRRRAKVYSDTGDTSARTLAKIADQWLTLQERGPKVFRWEKASELLESTARIKGLPESLRAWLEAQTEQVDLNHKAVKILQDAERRGNRARALAEEGKIDGALESYAAASRRYESIDAGSLVAREAITAGNALASEAFEQVTKDLRQGARAKRPDWHRLLSKVEQGQRFAVDAKDRALLRRLGDACRTNLEDEGRFVQAGKLIRQQNPAHYPTAQKLLAQVDSRSKIYPDAQAYLEWLEADTKVREAVKAYTRASGKRAFDLLGEAYGCRSLGADAKQSIQVRRTHWSRVVHAYERGMTSSHRGDKLEAIEELERVVELEPDPANRYRIRAKEEIADIRAKLANQKQTSLQSGLAALRRGQLRKANAWFQEVRADPTRTAGDLRVIERAVAERNAKEDMLAKAKRQLISDNRANFLRLRDVFDLLARWLPRQHGDRALARKHLKVVAARIRHWEKAAEEGALK